MRQKNSLMKYDGEHYNHAGDDQVGIHVDNTKQAL